jgi:hypothetical protein
MAAVELAARAGELDWASDILGRYLLVRPMSGLSMNTKLVPSFNDREQFASLWKRIIEIKNFSNHQIVASNPPKPPVPSGKPEGAMTAQYKRTRTDLSKLMRDHGLTVARMFESCRDRQPFQSAAKVVPKTSGRPSITS